jgi:hypothetical protein
MGDDNLWQECHIFLKLLEHSEAKPGVEICENQNQNLPKQSKRKEKKFGIGHIEVSE